MTAILTIWSKPNCVQCTMTIREATKQGVIYQVEDLSEHPEKVEEFEAKGMLSAPVVIPSDGSEPWSGFIPEKIAQFSLEHSEEEELMLDSQDFDRAVEEDSGYRITLEDFKAKNGLV